MQGGLSLPEHGASLGRLPPVVGAVEHQEWDGDFLETLPERDEVFLRLPGLFPLQVGLEVFSGAHPVASLDDLGGDQAFVEELPLEGFPRALE